MKSVLIGYLFLSLCATTFGQTITLHVKNKSGNDGKYEPRDRYSTGCWGIRGDGANATVWDANIWFNSFPGASGKYKITSYVILEADGKPPYKYTAGGRTLKEGIYPYAGGSYKCNTDNYDAKGTIDLGTHQINKGEKINVWGKSVYKCKHSGSNHGAYARWYQFVFTYAGGATGSEAAVAPRSGSTHRRVGPGESVALFAVSGRLVGTYPMQAVASGQVPLPAGLYLAKSRLGVQHVTIRPAPGH